MNKEMQMMVGLTAAISGDSSGQWIETIEKSGQNELVYNDILPKKINDYGVTKELYEQIGIVFGDDRDDLFCEVKLPDGWKKVKTDHSMWSNVVDEKGRERISIFYKAAFYDQDAFMNLKNRYRISTNYSDDYMTKEYVFTDHDGTVLHTFGSISKESQSEYGKDYFERDDKLAKEAREWALINYPDYQNPLCYW